MPFKQRNLSLEREKPLHDTKVKGMWNSEIYKIKNNYSLQGQITLTNKSYTYDRIWMSLLKKNIYACQQII